MSQKRIYWLEFEMRDQASARMRALVCAVAESSFDATAKAEAWLRRRNFVDVNAKRCRSEAAFSGIALAPIESVLLREALKRGAAGYVRPDILVE
ncbi:hypothetical protein CEK00_09310 [Stenotrophomonas maltophilia]|uniref:Uncharacterized protein n=1 Tax=Stenotrophomonas maltophilia TaxID=40324 RepID=A0A270MZ45_STEMA|nr:hypothetical protein [Stenotrophomonas maltophilia]PAM64628.1 hypothetical protein CEK00_21630 [Stenotrophomonas maltophilia]PAM71785.1 hypothetical protein CEK00_09310 [Stenotrophomonas maltophilia]